ncbi:MAG: hypothetical protein A2Y28_04640 [Chlamydiae bacterium GWC2_50_10]|nr:MAG: hypothetical protein A2Y28_04640 [Chlamydiae bacterium GWC2_50_10]OGN57242.1 MAG: hypothetical protein A3D18_00225 [Chlamydiae bacterium RIFCSPHIGHO2_02_FULL_49_29]OGN63398.1 MAG: hypothetical protein A3E26_02350 [Chlamydiae bacterium RIFCSPHIGHO2_12_FULL_49_32]OGN69312.1 MAG: hypothetical protein A3I15_03500 [Chlamydiae bacterium RIFCSPLOWO2_02_FULL_49_12]OGN74232.1 MAG: hypothetical protein A3G30_04785 [Chlamydiae bacterium RIFCSPLOWO2_12_FULL_49_12]HCJ84686.1 hypothetical protein [P
MNSKEVTMVAPPHICLQTNSGYLAMHPVYSDPNQRVIRLYKEKEKIPFKTVLGVKNGAGIKIYTNICMQHFEMDQYRSEMEAARALFAQYFGLLPDEIQNAMQSGHVAFFPPE